MKSKKSCKSFTIKHKHTFGISKGTHNASPLLTSCWTNMAFVYSRRYSRHYPHSRHYPICFSLNYNRLIILGNFNIHFFNTTDRYYKRLTEFFTLFSLGQIVREPTHYTDHSQTTIDLVCSNATIPSADIYFIPDLRRHAFITVRLLDLWLAYTSHYLRITLHLSTGTSFGTSTMWMTWLEYLQNIWSNFLTNMPQ